MAIVRAVKSGNWSDTTVWNTGALPTSADDVYSNTFTVTIDTSPTVLSVNNGAATGVTAGGSFSPSNGITLTCTGAGVIGSVANIGCIDSALTTGQSCTIVGSVNGSGTTNAIGLRLNGVGTINITGNIFGGTGNGSLGAVNALAGTLNITGNATGGASGNLTHAIQNNSTGTINITGTLTAGLGANNTTAAFNSTSAGTLTHTGSVVATNAYAISSSSATATVVLSGPFLTGSTGVNPVWAARWFWANSSLSPTYYQVRTLNLATIRPLYTADSVGGNPATSNVRSGTVYGPANELTGTCAVPGASSVLSGVPVDNTTGTATVSAASIRSALGLASANLDTQLAPLTNLDATVSSRLATSGYTAPPSVGDIATAVWAAATRTLTTAIDNSATIAAAVWGYATGRTITGGTVDTLTNAPSVPSAATIASQVRTELSTELARIDVATSTRLAPSGTLARVTLTDTTTTLTNAPDVPTEAEIAAQVRTELATELGRIDATVSSRLATSGYTTPPTATAITSAVWAAADKTGYSLTSAERQAIATAVEQSILNESDGQQVLNAIVGAIGNTNVDQVALVAAIRADLERTGGTLATRLAASSYTEPPTAAANATAVRSELTPELARVANCATVATTGQQIQDAVTN